MLDALASDGRVCFCDRVAVRGSFCFRVGAGGNCQVRFCEIGSEAKRSQLSERSIVFSGDPGEAAVDVRERTASSQRGFNGVGEARGFRTAVPVFAVETGAVRFDFPIQELSFGGPAAIHLPLGESDAVHEVKLRWVGRAIFVQVIPQDHIERHLVFGGKRKP
jgi:hypothetical protein